MLDSPPLTDEALTEVADALFLEHDKTQAENRSPSRRILMSERHLGIPRQSFRTS